MNEQIFRFDGNVLRKKCQIFLLFNLYPAISVSLSHAHTLLLSFNWILNWYNQNHLGIICNGSCIRMNAISIIRDLKYAAQN